MPYSLACFTHCLEIRPLCPSESLHPVSSSQKIQRGRRQIIALAQAHRQTDPHTNRPTHRPPPTHTHTHTYTDSQTEPHTNSHTHTHTHTYTHTHTHTHRYTDTDRPPHTHTQNPPPHTHTHRLTHRGPTHTYRLTHTQRMPAIRWEKNQPLA